ncbi:MAG: class I SAM-dependent methyltransferase [Candidatus Binataceae bacterium]
MIRVLKNWNEIGEAIVALRRAGLPLHPGPEKNWDQWLLRDSFSALDRSAEIVDLGCGGGATLEFLRGLGFDHVRGIDLGIPVGLRRIKFAIVNYRKFRIPFRMDRGDLTKTGYADSSFDAATSISTIEHQVPLDEFFHETARILKPGALLFLTTDYWEEKLEVDSQAFGLAWQIFSQEQISALIALGQSHGFALVQPSDVPSCAGRPVHWLQRDYTFIALLFRKGC